VQHPLIQKYKSGLFLLAIALLLGIFFRFAYLDRKVYWVDEVATSLRISGYTRQEAIQRISQSGIIDKDDLQKYQRLGSEKSFPDTIQALVKSPEHSPLYFLMARFWVQLFGSSVTAIRSLSVILGLLALPCLYWLCAELFESNLVGWVAIALFSVSPFYVAYAQEARPYSLWIVAILLSSTALLRAIRFNGARAWLFYTITLVLGLYTSLLSFLIAIAHGVYVLTMAKFRLNKVVKNYGIALTLAIVAFTPWVLVIIYNLQKVRDNTTWMKVALPIAAKIAVWFYSIVIVFVESPIYLAIDPIIITRIIVDLGLFSLIGFAFYFLSKQASHRILLFILSLTFIPFLIMALTDLILQRQSSAAPRYLIPLQLGVLLTVSYLIGTKNQPADIKPVKQQQLWRIIGVILLSIGVISCSLVLDKSPNYQKTRNLHNIPIAAIVNQGRSPIVVAENKEVLDIISLSYQLEDKVKIQVLSPAKTTEIPNHFSEVFLFNPSVTWRKQLNEEKHLKLKQTYEPKLLIPDEISLSLWQIEP
jgi:uncharacterized membrane protein